MAHDPSLVTNRKKIRAGVLEFSSDAQERINVTLLAEPCAHRLGIPGRASCRIASLKPWDPIRIVLNGRAAYDSGQLYTLEDYHLTLCCEPMPQRMPDLRVMDLQADLL